MKFSAKLCVLAVLAVSVNAQDTADTGLVSEQDLFGVPQSDQTFGEEEVTLLQDDGSDTYVDDGSDTYVDDGSNAFVDDGSNAFQVDESYPVDDSVNFEDVVPETAMVEATQDAESMLPGLTIEINQEVDASIPEESDALVNNDVQDVAFMAASAEEPVPLADVTDMENNLPKKIVLPREGYADGFVVTTVPKSANPVQADSPADLDLASESNTDQKVTVVVTPKGFTQSESEIPQAANLVRRR